MATFLREFTTKTTRATATAPLASKPSPRTTQNIPGAAIRAPFHLFRPCRKNSMLPATLISEFGTTTHARHNTRPKTTPNAPIPSKQTSQSSCSPSTAASNSKHATARQTTARKRKPACHAPTPTAIAHKTAQASRTPAAARLDTSTATRPARPAPRKRINPTLPPRPFADHARQQRTMARQNAQTKNATPTRSSSTTTGGASQNPLRLRRSLRSSTPGSWSLTARRLTPQHCSSGNFRPAPR